MLLSVRTISEYVEARILPLEDLKEALRLAMRLEFATLPPYLCAEWSIKSENDPDQTAGVLHQVVMDEMHHFALAGNLLTAVGGTPSLAHADFLPEYPAWELPGGIPQKLPIDLKPLVTEQLEVFMQIEHPKFPPVALAAEPPPPTIGAFYDTIIATFQETRPAIDPGAHAVSFSSAAPIRSVDDAIETIDRIKSEGEGLPDSPDSPTADEMSHAHYYLFKELYKQHRLIKTDGKWDFTGEPIILPGVNEFAASAAEPEMSLEFRRTLTGLLTSLESCWTSGAAVPTGAMFHLERIGRPLIAAGVRPEFTWAPPEG